MKDSHFPWASRGQRVSIRHEHIAIEGGPQGTFFSALMLPLFDTAKPWRFSAVNSLNRLGS